MDAAHSLSKEDIFCEQDPGFRQATRDTIARTPALPVLEFSILADNFPRGIVLPASISSSVSRSNGSNFPRCGVVFHLFVPFVVFPVHERGH